MRKPVTVPTEEAATDGTMRRRPELVALSSRTAWKKRGMLNRTAFMMIAPRTFDRMRPARGCRVRRSRGMIGSATRDSIQMNKGKQTAKMTSDVMTNGWDQGKILPPRLIPRMRDVIEVVSKMEP